MVWRPSSQSKNPKGFHPQAVGFLCKRNTRVSGVAHLVQSSNFTERAPRAQNQRAQHGSRTRTGWSRQQLATSSLQLGTSISKHRIVLTLPFTLSMSCNPAPHILERYHTSHRLALWECLMSPYFVHSEYLGNTGWLCVSSTMGFIWNRMPLILLKAKLKRNGINSEDYRTSPKTSVVLRGSPLQYPINAVL